LRVKQTTFDFFFLNKIEYRAVIKYFVLKDLTPIEINNELDSTLGEFSLSSFQLLKNGLLEFKRGRMFINNDEHSGHSLRLTKLLKRFISC